MIDTSTYLSSLVKKLAISPSEKEKIDNSLEHLKTKIWSVFQNKLLDVVVFGSYDRGTKLNDAVDKYSDVDIMIIFKENEFQPQTYLNYLRNFGETTYPRSEIFPEHPTIVVELAHVRFELVPAYIETGFWGGTTLYIPASPSKDVKWIETDPTSFKQQLIEKNNDKGGQTIQIIKIFKYWNALNDYPFPSLTLEKVAIDGNVSGANLKECFYDFISEFSDYEMNESQEKLFNDLVERRRRLKSLEEGGTPEYIEQELTAFLPLF